MIYLENDTLKITEDKNEELKQAFVAELKLFKGENPLNTSAGIDYLAVFNNEAFLSVEAEQLADKYSQKFDSITFGEFEIDEDKINSSISMVFKNGEQSNEAWSIQ